MPHLDIHSRKHRFKDAPEIHVLEVAGFIDASTVARFDSHLSKRSRGKAPSIIIDFGKVDYINSTGIGAVVKHFHQAQENGGELVVANVPRDVGLTMHLLGVTTFVPFLKDTGSAIGYFRQPRAGNGDSTGYYDHLLAKKGVRKGERRVRYRIPLHRKRREVPETSSVLMVVHRPDVFTDVMKLRLHEPKKGQFIVFTDCPSALESFQEGLPDLVVVEDRVDGAEEFLAKVKMEKGRSLTSVIKLYPKTTDIDGLRDFKIWENDYLREPFEVMELFRLCEAEIRRVPRDREVYLHQVRFQFRSSPENVEKAKTLAEDIIARSGFDGDAALGMKSAFKEAIDNAVIHGNRSDPEKCVDVMFIMRSDRVAIQVEDEGSGFDFGSLQEKLGDKDAFQKAKRRIIEKGKRGGLGILLIHKCMDRVEFLRSGNVIRMEKSLR